MVVEPRIRALFMMVAMIFLFLFCEQN